MIDRPYLKINFAGTMFSALISLITIIFSEMIFKSMFRQPVGKKWRPPVRKG